MDYCSFLAYQQLGRRSGAPKHNKKPPKASAFRSVRLWISRRAARILGLVRSQRADGGGLDTHV